VIAAVVFDLDGVLADSEPLHLRAYQEVLSSMGATLPREEYYARYLGYDDEGVFRALSAARSWNLSPRQIATLIEEKTAALQTMLAGTDVLYAGAADCVARLAAEWPLAIASGAQRHEITAILRAGNIERHFRAIVAAGDAAGKPSPDPYRRAAELLGVAPESAVAIEDSRWGIQSARGAGMLCIGITHTYPFAELMEADAIVSSLHELTPGLIRSLRSG
jgi:HAD superfamily hydrolase (TIGR01509 family)